MEKTKLSTLCNGIIEAGWLIAVVAVPVFFNIYTARTFEPDKITFLRMIVSVMLLASLVSALERGLAINRNSSEPFGKQLIEWFKIPFVLPTFIFAISYLISGLLSISPAVSLWGSYQRLQGTYSMLTYVILFVLIATHLRTREQIDRLVSIMIITSIPVSLYGIVQRYGLDPLPWAGDVTRRVASTLGNAIFVSSYLIMVMPLTVSRLVDSMTAIIKEEKASWGHTVLAAIYIFIIAIQTLTIIFSGSRGPMLGILASLYIMGLLFIMRLRQYHEDRSMLGLKEILMGIGFVVPVGIATLIGGVLVGGIGYGIETIASVEQLSLVGVAIGGVLGLLGIYIFMATTERGWRWLWISWLGVAVAGVVFILMLNIRGTALDPYIEPVRRIPHLNRLTTILQADGSGTGAVRLLIWDSAKDLVMFHEPLGVPGDPDAKIDSLSFIRPLIGYGPESMFNAFAYAYPPDLAHVEKRGSSADRSHNETMDSWVITGALGFFAYYYIMVSVFLYGLVWTGWTPTRASKNRLYVLFIGCAAIGGGLAYLSTNSFKFVPLGLPFGLAAGIIIHLIWQGIVGTNSPKSSAESPLTQHYLLMVGLFGATVGHFIEVHFVFSIAATYTYFWAFRGLLLAVDRMDVAAQKQVAEKDMANEPVTTEAKEAVLAEEPVHSRRKRKRQQKREVGKQNFQPKTRRSSQATGLSWEIVVGGYGLAMAILMIILTFDFIVPQFEFSFSDQDSMSLLWMYLITWGIGLAISLSDIAIRRSEWQKRISWGRAVALYSASSLSYFILYYMVHRTMFGQQMSVTSPQDAISAADILVNGLLALYIFLLLLTVLFGLTLSWQDMKRLRLWDKNNWWLYVTLTAIFMGIIWFKNINVVRADIYLKEGERYRGAKQWEAAILLHDLARSIDSDEDFYYLMLALDYQLMAQDNRLSPEQRQYAQNQGEKIAIEARKVNPYNPDNTGNMGRYYFTLSQIASDPELRQTNMELAKNYFEQAVILAPTNVIYHNLLAQTAYMEGDYDKAIARLEKSLEVDPRYMPTWTLLGDVYAAKGDVDQALEAHTQGMQPVPFSKYDKDGIYSFADQSSNLRLNFYLSSGRVDDLATSLQEVASETPANHLIYKKLGDLYYNAGEQEKAVPNYEQVIALNPNDAATAKQLATIYLALDNIERSTKLLEQVIELTPNDLQARGALGYNHAREKRYDEAIAQFQFVLQQTPEDYNALQNIAVLYQDNGQLNEALNMAQRAKPLAPEDQKVTWDSFIANIQNQLNGTEVEFEK